MLYERLCLDRYWNGFGDEIASPNSYIKPSSFHFNLSVYCQHGITIFTNQMMLPLTEHCQVV